MPNPIVLKEVLILCVCVPPKPNAFYIYSKWKLTTEVIFLITKANRSSARRQNGRALPWHSYLGVIPASWGKVQRKGHLESWRHLTDGRADEPRETASFSRNDTTGLCHLSTIIWASLAAQRVKNLPAMQETWVQSLGQDDPLEKEMATHSSILAQRIPGTEEPGWLQSLGS